MCCGLLSIFAALRRHTCERDRAQKTEESRMSEMPTPAIVDRATWKDAHANLLVREKAHTHEGDALAAARRRMPMMEVPDVEVTGPDGPVRLHELFGDHDQLVVYKHMAHIGQPIEAQCAGCTISIWGLRETDYLERRGIGFVVFFEGPWDEAKALRDFMGYSMPWYSVDGLDDPDLGTEFGEYLFLLRKDGRIYLTYSVTGRGTEAMMASLQLIDRTVYGRGERWEQSPEGWPQPYAPSEWWWQDGRPVPQWNRPGATLVAADAHAHHHEH
jgi:predicted dithiol-disulfide oxidoreductase (DUF899 family)